MLVAEAMLSKKPTSAASAHRSVARKLIAFAALSSYLCLLLTVVTLTRKAESVDVSVNYATWVLMVANAVILAAFMPFVRLLHFGK
jgi:multidrug transporter EmrE-like cation transporter